jgi:hypothetical protein
MASQLRVLPTVLRMRDQINDVFTRYVGPIAVELCRDEFEHWHAEGEVGPTALNRYIARLTRYISDDAARRAFITEAVRCIQLPGGKK